VSFADADDVISRRLVTFRDVRELQQRNAELLAVIREMSANQVTARVARWFFFKPKFWYILIGLGMENV
jgi:hypothetical protein